MNKMNNLGFIVSGIVAGCGTALVLNEQVISKIYITGDVRSENTDRCFINFGSTLIKIEPYEKLSKVIKIIGGLCLVCFGALTGALIQGGIATIGPMLLTCPPDLSLIFSHAKVGAVVGLIFGLFTEPKIQHLLLNMFVCL